MDRDALVREYRDVIGSERSEKDHLIAKKLYIHMAGDVVPGLLLSQIVYWHSNAEDGKPRLRVTHRGQPWLVKARADWWDEICLKPRQVDRALKLLRDRGLIETKVARFAGDPTTHIRILWPKFLRLRREFLDAYADASDAPADDILPPAPDPEPADAPPVIPLSPEGDPLLRNRDNGITKPGFHITEPMNNAYEQEPVTEEALAVEESVQDKRSSSSRAGARTSDSGEQQPPRRSSNPSPEKTRRRIDRNSERSEKPEVQKPAPRDALTKLKPETQTLLGELALREDQLKGEDLGRARTAADVAHALSDLLERPGVHDLRLERTIRKILVRTDIAKSAIGVVRADIERQLEDSSDASPTPARSQTAVSQHSLARSGSYVSEYRVTHDRITYVHLDSDPPNDDPTGTVLGAEGRIVRGLAGVEAERARRARRLARLDKREEAERNRPGDSYVQFGVRIDRGTRPHPKGPSRDVRVSEKGVVYELLAGERTDDKFKDVYYGIYDDYDVPCGLAGRDAEHDRLAAPQLEDAPEPKRAPQHV